MLSWADFYFDILLGLICTRVDSGMIRFMRLPIHVSHRFGRQRTIENAPSAIMFSNAPLSATPPPVDPDRVASFRQLIAVPPPIANTSGPLMSANGVTECRSPR